MVVIEYTSEFKRNIKLLVKRYRSILQDIQPILDQLNTGIFPGDKIKGSGFTIYKVRVRNSDSLRGKSGGYRVIYYLKTQSSVVLITIYSKSDQSDITTREIKKIISEFLF